MKKYSKVKIRESGQSKEVKIGADSKPKINDSIVEKWQGLLDTLADVVKVPSALIMRLNEDSIEVFLKSNTEGNPYKKGEEAKLIYGLYCETVIGTQKKLIVPDATESSVWSENNPDVDINMISYLGYPINWPDGEVLGTICLLDNNKNDYNEKYSNLLFQMKKNIETDLELLNLNNDLQVKNEELNRLNKTQSKFLSLIAHDVRGGVGILDEFLKLALVNFDQYSGETMKEILQNLSQNASKAYLTLDNLLNWSKNDIANLEPRKSRFDIIDTIEDLIDYFGHAVRIKKIELSAKYDNNETFVFADENMIKVSLRNVISNAIKYTATGGKISIAVHSEAGECRIEIADNGIGMDDETLNKLFSYNNRHTEGTDGEESAGIGLMLVKEFLDKNGARVDIESKPERGTTFTVVLKKA